MTRHRLPFPTLLVALTLLASASCASRTAPPAAAPSPVPGPPAAATPAKIPLPDSVVWFRTSVEYRATALQAYRLASLMLDRALVDAHAAMWGLKWIALPNPMYGSWKTAAGQ